ncbi:MAG: hypothetical protein V3575_02840 [Candidatus Absconditabacteria bacterium]
MQLIIKHNKELDYNYVHKHFIENKRQFDTLVSGFPELSSNLFLESDEKVRNGLIHNFFVKLYENNQSILESKVQEIQEKVNILNISGLDNYFGFDLQNYILHVSVGFLPFNNIDLYDNYIGLYFNLFDKELDYEHLLIFLLTVRLISDRIILNFPNYNLSTYNDIAKMLYLSIVSSKEDLKYKYKVYYNKKFDYFQVEYEGNEYSVREFFVKILNNYSSFESLIGDKDTFEKILNEFDSKSLVYKYLSKSKNLHGEEVLAKDEKYCKTIIIK